MADETWDVRLHRRHRDDDSAESRPAADVLRSCPKTVAARLLAIVDAVAASPTAQFTGGGMWEAMHG